MVTDELDTDFDLLRDARRRYLLYYLCEMYGNAAELEAVANAVYKYETAGTDAAEHSTRESVRIALHHIHLPLLADAGVVDYDTRQGTVRFTGDSTLEEWVERARREELD